MIIKHSSIVLLIIIVIFQHQQAFSNWRVLHDTIVTENLYGVHLYNVNIGFAVGWSVNSIILKTTDGGEKWDTIKPPSSYLFGINMLDENRIFITGYSFDKKCGLLYKSSDGGSNWQSQFFDGVDNPYSYGLYTYEILNDNVAFVSGYNSAIFKTTDGGNTWMATDTDTNEEVFKVLCIFNDSIGYAASGRGSDFSHINAVYRTTDCGNSWGLMRQRDYELLIAAMAFKSPVEGFMFGSYSGSAAVFKTTDSAKTWAQVFQGEPGKVLQSAVFADSLHGFAVGDGGYCIETNDGGDSWSDLIKVTDEGLLSVSFPDAYTGYAVGTKGIMLKYEGIMGLSDNKYITNNFNIYPNPVKTIGRLEFEGNAEGEYELKFFNELGIEILGQSGYTNGLIDFDISYITKGLYFYSVDIGGNIHRGKFIKN